MSPLRLLGIALLATLATQAMSPVAIAQDSKEFMTLDDVLRVIRAERDSVSRENEQRVQRFLQRRNEQQAELQRVRNQVEAAETQAAELESKRNQNERELEELQAQLDDRQGEFGELFGAARAAASDLREQLGESLVSAQYRGRGDVLADIAETESLPSIDQLEYLWYTMMQEASEQSKVVQFDSNVIGTDNQPQEIQVTRLGPFTAFSGGNYLQYNEGKLRFLARQPGGGATNAARNVENHEGDGFVAGVIDPSLGRILGLVVETPTLRERIDQGGGIGYVILIVAAFGILLAVYKWITLTITQRKVKAQMAADELSENNPLGRVMMAYEQNRNTDIETLQLKLDDAVLKELPKLESGLNIVKVLAAAAPLMGLLGTVIGMVVTFQAITLFGTGDPKLMAGGISQALVTTVLGLVAAIPLLLLHAFAAGASRRISQILEEQSAGLVAEYAEGRSS